MTGERPPVVDAAERERIERTGLHETLFVEAGAGTGKTHELVERVVHLVVDAGIPLSAIAAITFTEAAAAELRDRVREAVERRLASRPAPDEAEACRQALDEVDEAAIATLHGFALRILGEHPLEVGLPPRVQILDEVSSQLAFQARWRRFVDELYADPDAEELVLRAWALGIEIDRPRSASLRDVAEVFEDSWDRLGSTASAEVAPLPAVDLGPLAAALRAMSAVHGTCAKAADTLRLRGLEVAAQVQDVLAVDDQLEQLARLTAGRDQWKVGRGRGSKQSWDDVVAAREALDRVGVVAGEIVQAAVDQVLRRLAVRLARFTTAAAEERRAEGRLDFHDLLVLARRLVRQSASARASLHQRYQRLLLDEFQDTDPIQIEVAVLIAAAVTGADPDRHWSAVVTDPGRLFFVGDPKQSIYRFRRADIGLFLEARDAFGGGSTVPLRQSFRTVPPVLDWVNHVFGELMRDEVPGAQAEYVPLAAHRQPSSADHRVVLLGGPRDLTARGLREEEAASVAEAIGAIRRDPAAWLVQDQLTRVWREPRMADITILVPTRTSLRQLEDALDAVSIPFRVAAGTLVYDTQEVREVLDALRAVDDPGDAIALVGALRSPLYACSDVDLLTYRQAGGRWDLRRTPPPALGEDHPVVRAVAHLRSLWEVRWWHEPSALLERLLRERQVHALAFSHRRPREVWRRLRFLVDQARAFEEAGGGGLRPFLAWAELQRIEGSRVHEPLQAERDDDAVSIQTIHGSKGLEFPITILSGASTQIGGRRRGVQVLWEGDTPEVRLRKDTATDHHARLADLEAEMDAHERARLLYVACTRARDHLIVSTFHAAGKASYGEWLTRLSAGAEETSCRRLELPAADVAPTATGDAPGTGTTPHAAPADERATWLAERAHVLADQARPRFVSATAVAAAAAAAAAPPPDEQEEDRDPDAAVAVRRRGRAGSAVGRAVHAVLQLLDGDLARLDDLAAQQAHLESVPDAAGTVAALVRSALRAPSVRAAGVAARSWRELYVAAPVGDQAVEGYVDLLYETADGLVLVDYKTDAVAGPSDVDAKVARYRHQIAAYVLALEASTGLTVTAAFLVFCTAGAPIERPVPDLEAATLEVQALLRPAADAAGALT